MIVYYYVVHFGINSVNNGKIFFGNEVIRATHI